MLDFVSILFTDQLMGYAAAPRVAFIVYGIQTFFTAIVIIIIIASDRNNENDFKNNDL